MVPVDSKSNQLRVRVTAEQRELLDKLCAARQRGETVSDLVREAIAVLTGQAAAEKAGALSPAIQTRLERLALLLKRESRQVEAACIEGILDLIEQKCDVPLIVMEARLHLKYRDKEEAHEHLLSPSTDPSPNPPTTG